MEERRARTRELGVGLAGSNVEVRIENVELIPDTRPRGKCRHLIGWNETLMSTFWAPIQWRGSPCFGRFATRLTCQQTNEQQRSRDVHELSLISVAGIFLHEHVVSHPMGQIWVVLHDSRELGHGESHSYYVKFS